MFGLVIISIFLVAGLHLSGQVLPSAIFLLLGYLLYFAIWVLLALYISSLVRQSSVALVCLLAFWVFNTFYITRIGGLMVNSLVNLPSSFQFSHNIRLDNELGLNRNAPATLRQKKFEDSLLQHYRVDSLSQLPLNIRGLNLQRSEEYGYRIFEKNYGKLEADYLKQDAILTKLNLLSPAQSMRSVSAGLSGTDINKHLHFAKQAELHRRLIAHTMNNDIARNSAGIENYEVSPDFWKKIPPFYYHEKKLGDSIAQQWMSIVSLLMWLLALCLLLKYRAKKITGLP
jgi:ABC-2 type transport system permease protein